MVEMPDRRRETLEAEIKQCFHSTWYSNNERWLGCLHKVEEIASGNYTHSVIVHEHNFVDPTDPTIHTQQFA
eukprot:snap_masked-scaffold786_size97209-processed-gene-0.11 protein:Tk03994 transcript:snap_masked-scaffold786_size97209-processed-gene-0.11-mRNA-1 annotation:"hypothetical protein CLF_106104"